MGSHFDDWSSYNGVAFLGIFNRVTRMGSHLFQEKALGTRLAHFRAFEGKKIICLKVTKMGSIIGHRIVKTSNIL